MNPIPYALTGLGSKPTNFIGCFIAQTVMILLILVL